jgi:hypothetical protein
MSWFISKHGSHDVKFGAQYEYVGASSTAQDNLNGTFFFKSDLDFNAADPRTYPRPAADSCARRAEPLSEGALRRCLRAGQMAGESGNVQPRTAL